MILRTIAVLLLILSASTVIAQPAGSSLEASAYYGRVLPHTKRFKPPINGALTGGEICLLRQLDGSRLWHSRWQYSRYGIALSYYNYDGDKILGSGIGSFLFTNINLLNTPRVELTLRPGAGIAYLTRPYDPISNPLNNVIGSHLNGLVDVKLAAAYHLDPKWTLTLGGHLIHSSNGGTQFPNLGINSAAFSLGLRYTPQRLEPQAFRYSQARLIDSLPRRWHLSASLGWAYHERGGAGAAQYPTYISQIEGIWHTGYINKLALGILHEYNQGLVEYARYTDPDATDAQNRRRGHRWSLTFADEILYGRCSMVTQVGYYVGRAYMRPAPITFRLGMRYYYIHRPQLKAHIGIYLKSHFATAEYFALATALEL